MPIATADAAAVDPAALYQVWSPAVQWGFCGFCIVLVVIIVWLVSKLFGVLERNNTVVGNNTAAITSLNAAQTETRDLVKGTKDAVEDVRDRLLARRCPCDPPPPETSARRDS